MDLEHYLGVVRALRAEHPKLAVLATSVAQGSGSIALRSISGPARARPDQDAECPVHREGTNREPYAATRRRRGDFRPISRLSLEFGPLRAVMLALSPAAIDATALALDPQTAIVKLRPVECGSRRAVGLARGGTEPGTFGSGCSAAALCRIRLRRASCRGFSASTARPIFRYCRRRPGPATSASCGRAPISMKTSAAISPCWRSRAMPA